MHDTPPATTARQYQRISILSFDDRFLFLQRNRKALQRAFLREAAAGHPAYAQRKLKQLGAAATLDFLRVPPGNRLEQLSGDRNGQWSIRINDQWRICSRWEGNAYDVEITDFIEEEVWKNATYPLCIQVKFFSKTS